MSKPLSPDDPPDDQARFIDAWLGGLRRDAAEGFAAFDRGEGIATTADELIDSIVAELDLTS